MTVSSPNSLCEHQTRETASTIRNLRRGLREPQRKLIDLQPAKQHCCFCAFRAACLRVIESLRAQPRHDLELCGDENGGAAAVYEVARDARLVLWPGHGHWAAVVPNALDAARQDLGVEPPIVEEEWRDVFRALSVSSWLPHGCLTVASRLPHGCLTVASGNSWESRDA